MQVSGNRRFASYTNLPPGDYTLQVKYTPDRENEGENVTELKITIVPYFYKKVWFILLIIILALPFEWASAETRLFGTLGGRFQLNRHAQCTPV